MALPSDNNRPIDASVVLGKNTKTEKDVTISDEERQSGMHVLGATQTGKTTLLTRMFLQDIKNKHGGLFVDVDGDSIDALLPRIPQERMEDVILLDLAELARMERYIGINPLSALRTDADPDAVVDRYMHVFKMLWHIGKDTPRLENTLRASLLTLAINNLTIAEMPFLLENRAFRKRCIEAIPITFATEGLRGFWKDDFDELYVQEQLKYADSTLNKVRHFLMVQKVAYAVGQGKTTIDFREIMDTKKILLLKLNEQEIGETTVRFLGAFLMAELKNALFSRSNVLRSERSFFSFMADEWQLYLTPDFKDILTRGAKYGIAPSTANQALSQLDEVDRAIGINKALRGITEQVNTLVTFRVNEEDAATRAAYYAKDPPPAETRKEPVLTIAGNPLEMFKQGHRHRNNRVNELLEKYFRSQFEEGRVTCIEVCNRFLINAMQGKLFVTNEQKDLFYSLGELLYLLDKIYYWSILQRQGESIFLLKRFSPKDVFTRPEKQEKYERDLKEAEEVLPPGETEAYLELLKSYQGNGHFSKEKEEMLISSRCYHHLMELSIAAQKSYQYYVKLEQLRVKEGCPVNCCVTVYGEKALNPFNGLLPHYGAMCYYTRHGMVAKEKTDKLTTTEIEERKICLGIIAKQPMTERELYNKSYYRAAYAKEIEEARLEREEYTQRWNDAVERSERDAERRGREVRNPNYYWLQKQDLAHMSSYDLKHFMENAPLPPPWVKTPKEKEIEKIDLIHEFVGYRDVTYYKYLLAEKDTDPILQERWKKALQLAQEDLRLVKEQITEWDELATLLQAEPIMVASGQYEEKELARRTHTDMEKEKAHELVGLTNGIAEVAIRSRGDRNRPRMETKQLEPVKDGKRFLEKEEIATLLQERRLQALNNAIAYTTEKMAVGLEVWKRRQRFGIAPSPDVQTPQEEKEHDAPEPVPHAKRRTKEFSLSLIPESYVPDSLSEENLLRLLYLFGYLDIENIARLVHQLPSRESVKEHHKNNLREHRLYGLNKFERDGLIEVNNKPRKELARGRIPIVYSLTDRGIQRLKERKAKADLGNHLMQLNDLLVSAVLLPTVEPCITRKYYEHEYLLRQHPIPIGNNKAVVPDGIVLYSLGEPYGEKGEIAGICFEWDEGTESPYQLQDKFNAWIIAASGAYQDRFNIKSLTIAFCCENENRARTLKKLAERTLEKENRKSWGELFVFGAFDPAAIDPLTLMTTPLFKQPFDTTAHALIEKLNSVSLKQEEEIRQPTPTSDAQLEQAIAALTEERWMQARRKGLIDLSLSYPEWHMQEVKKLFKQKDE